MRVALCFHGYFINSGGMPALYQSRDYIDNSIFSKADVDVFFHSWDSDPKVQNLIKYMYNPKVLTFETQKDFQEELSTLDLDWFESGFDRKSTMYKGNSPFQTLSFLYSRKRVIEIKNSYEKSAGLEYDVVILARTDLGTRGKEHPQVYYVTNINFDPTSDMTRLHAAYWNQMNWGYADHWFYGNKDVMNLVGSAYDKVGEFYQPDGDYVESITSGWIDSNASDPFSNEQLKKASDRSKNLMTFDKWQCIDNHKFYKWYFFKCGLYEDTKFMDITGG